MQIKSSSEINLIIRILCGKVWHNLIKSEWFTRSETKFISLLTRIRLILIRGPLNPFVRTLHRNRTHRHRLMWGHSSRTVIVYSIVVIIMRWCTGIHSPTTWTGHFTSWHHNWRWGYTMHSIVQMFTSTTSSLVQLIRIVLVVMQMMQMMSCRRWTGGRWGGLQQSPINRRGRRETVMPVRACTLMEHMRGIVHRGLAVGFWGARSPGRSEKLRIRWRIVGWIPVASGSWVQVRTMTLRIHGCQWIVVRHHDTQNEDRV